MSEIRDIWIRAARHIMHENLYPLNLSSAEGNILLHLYRCISENFAREQAAR